MIRREFIKLATVGAGILGLPRLAGARPVPPGNSLFFTAEIGVFFPSLSLVRRLQEEPSLSFVMVEHKSSAETGARQFEVALRLPVASLENSNHMNQADRALVERKLMAGLSRELRRHPGDLRLQVNSAPAFYHPYLADAQNRAVFCRITAA
jgi:hypothetical protein